MTESRRNSPCFTIQIAKFAIPWLDLSGIDLGVMRQYILPPLLFIELLEMNMNSLLIFCTIDENRGMSLLGHSPKVHVLSSTLISLQSSPSSIFSFPFSPTLSFFFRITMVSSFPLVPLGTGTMRSSSPKSCLHV